MLLLKKAKKKKSSLGFIKKRSLISHRDNVNMISAHSQERETSVRPATGHRNEQLVERFAPPMVRARRVRPVLHALGRPRIALGRTTARGHVAVRVHAVGRPGRSSTEAPDVRLLFWRATAAAEDTGDARRRRPHPVGPVADRRVLKRTREHGRDPYRLPAAAIAGSARAHRSGRVRRRGQREVSRRTERQRRGIVDQQRSARIKHTTRT